MPQLNTSTWFITIMTMLPTLYLIMQLKLLNMNYYRPPLTKNPTHKSTMTTNNQNERKSIYPILNSNST
uniref:ATP synthase complex subunit 8 n=1 Tax=Cercocebus atys atys TaxID=1592215 RepID=A0A0U1YJ02_CERAT|nr:ATP synthase F0 subunit 8 [Cercocebus atys atys]